MTTSTKALLISTAAALLGASITAPADAAMRTASARGGTQAVSGTVQSDQFLGRPFISFPLRCEARGTCAYSLWVEYVPALSVPQWNLSEWEPRDFDQCLFWVTYHPSILPMRGVPTRHFSADGIEINEATIHGTGREAPGEQAMHSNSGMSSSFFGTNYEYLTIKQWWLEIEGATCRLGFRACFSSSAPRFDETGTECPLGE